MAVARRIREARISLDVFLAITKTKTVDSAGFRLWIKSRKVRRMTRAEWHSLLGEYRTMPAGS